MINLQKLYYVVDVDIKGFFDNVNHTKLIQQIWHMGIRDKKLLCYHPRDVESTYYNAERNGRTSDERNAARWYSVAASLKHCTK